MKNKLLSSLFMLSLSISSFAGPGQQQQQAASVDTKLPGWTKQATEGSDHWNQFVARCLTEKGDTFGTQYDAKKIEVVCKKRWYTFKSGKMKFSQKLDDGIFMSYSKFKIEGPKGQDLNVQAEGTMEKEVGALKEYSIDTLVPYLNTKTWGHDNVTCDMIKDAFGHGTAEQGQQQAQAQAQQQQAQQASVDTSREAFCGYLESILEENGKRVAIKSERTGEAFVPNQVLPIEGPSIR